jgi:RNA polymerase sigma factor (sigma-70 family)
MLEVLDCLKIYIKSTLNGVESKVDVEDVLQDAAIAILSGVQAAKKTPAMQRTKAVWLARSARRKAFRDAKRDHLRVVEGENPKHEAIHDPLGELVKAEQIESLHAAFAAMDPNIEHAVKMRFYEDATLLEIAEAFGVSMTTASAMIKRGLTILKEAVGE